MSMIAHELYELHILPDQSRQTDFMKILGIERLTENHTRTNKNYWVVRNAIETS